MAVDAEVPGYTTISYFRTQRLHDIPYSRAPVLLNQNVSPKVVQERLGHSCIQITLDTHSHITPRMQEAAAKSFDDAFTNGYNDKRAEENGD